jgi:hypothetical protein
MRVSDWVYEMELFQVDEKVTSTMLLPSYQELNRLAYNHDVEQLDYDIQNLCVEKLNIVPLCGIPRSISVFQFQLSNWNNLLDRVEAELIRRGYDSKRKMRGLKKV